MKPKWQRAIWVAALMVGAIAMAGADEGGTGREDDLGVRALERTGATVLEDWAYTETTVDSERTTVRRFDPRLAPGARWELVSVDGREPTEAEKAEWADDSEAGQEGSDEAGNGRDDEEKISAMVRPGSLVLLEESDADLLYRFEPMSDDPDDDKLYRHLDATLRVVRDGPYVATLSMKSRKPFSLGFGKKFKEFALAMDFTPQGPDGQVLPQRVTIRMNIRAMLVMKVRQTVEVTYSDYEYIGPGGRSDGESSTEAG